MRLTIDPSATSTSPINELALSVGRGAGLLDPLFTLLPPEAFASGQ
jgi:hypothetical protein